MNSNKVSLQVTSYKLQVVNYKLQVITQNQA
jgi:hypothetical protein